MKFREKNLSTGTKIFLGKNAENNDELMKKYKGKENTILHTIKPGSSFCVIDKLNPNKKEIYEAGVVCASYSQAWRNKKSDIKMHVFNGKNTGKKFWMKKGTWKVKNAKTINIKKQDILKFKRKNDTRTNPTRKKQSK